MSALRPVYEEALAEWKRRVEADKEQVDRLREVPDGKDFYGPIASAFIADPRREGEQVLDMLRSLVRPDETWLDIGAGAGRYALPVALLAKKVICVEPSSGMLDGLREGMANHGISNVEIVQSRWPSETPVEADCSLISFVGNDIADIGPFIEAMEASTRRMCTFINFERPPASTYGGAWLAAHGEPRALLPALPEFLSLLLSKERLFEVRLAPRPVTTLVSFEHALDGARRQTWVEPGGEKDQRLQAYFRETLVEEDGRYHLPGGAGTVGVVTWSPRG